MYGYPKEVLWQLGDLREAPGFASSPRDEFAVSVLCWAQIISRHDERKTLIKIVTFFTFLMYCCPKHCWGGGTLQIERVFSKLFFEFFFELLHTYTPQIEDLLRWSWSKIIGFGSMGSL